MLSVWVLKFFVSLQSLAFPKGVKLNEILNSVVINNGISETPKAKVPPVSVSLVTPKKSSCDRGADPLQKEKPKSKDVNGIKPKDSRQNIETKKKVSETANGKGPSRPGISNRSLTIGQQKPDGKGKKGSRGQKRREYWAIYKKKQAAKRHGSINSGSGYMYGPPDNFQSVSQYGQHYDRRPHYAFDNLPSNSQSVGQHYPRQPHYAFQNRPGNFQSVSQNLVGQPHPEIYTSSQRRRATSIELLNGFVDLIEATLRR